MKQLEVIAIGLLLVWTISLPVSAREDVTRMKVESLHYPVQQAVMTHEICNNGVDDDGDGQIDCNDGDCEVLVNGTFEDVPMNITNPGSSVTFPKYPVFMGSWAAVNIDGEVFLAAADRPAAEGSQYASLLQNAGFNPRSPWNESSWDAGGYDRFLFIAHTLPNKDYNITFYHAGDFRYNYFGANTLVQVQSLETDQYLDTLITTPGAFDWQAASFQFSTDSATHSVAILFSSYGPINSSVVLDDLRLCGPRVPEVEAIDDQAVTLQHTGVVIDVLGNDLHLPENGLEIEISAQLSAAGGSLELLEDGTVQYDPPTDFAGLDSFQYIICNTDAAPVQCSQAWVYVDVLLPLPEVTTDTFLLFTMEDEPLHICDDTYYELRGTAITTQVCGEGKMGNCVPTGGTCMDYQPFQDQHGEDTLCIEVCDADQCDRSVFLISILPVNDAPVLGDDHGITTAGTEVEIDLLANDADPQDDGEVDPWSVLITQEPEHGTVIYLGDGTVIYRPDQGYAGKDHFTYTACDLGEPMPALCGTAAVFVDVEAGEEIPCFIPNSFSPNGDGLYEYFTVACADAYPQLEIAVYDRHGRQVYRSEKGYNNDWDGRLMQGGGPLKKGTYYWMVSFNDGLTPDRAGHVLIWR